jgi:hypothetical protein
MVRISLAAYNTKGEIDTLVKQLKKIAADEHYYKKHYQYSAATRSYMPAGMENRFWQEIDQHCRALLK